MTPTPDSAHDAGTAKAAVLDPALIEILACPSSDHAAVREVRDDLGHALVCTECGRRFPVRDGIPVMLLSEATGGPADDVQAVAGEGPGE